MTFNKLKRLITEITGIEIPINEMANMGSVGEYTIVIESNDHNPPYFHVKLNNKTVTRIEIPKDYLDRPYDLVYLKLATRLSNPVENKLIDWFRNFYKKSKNTNLELLQLEWDILHNTDYFNN